MPLISPILESRLRRHWQVVVAAVACALFFAFHVAVFSGAAHRFERAIQRATDMGLAVDPTQPLAVTPPRLLVLLAANMLPATVTDANREAGTLAASMLEEITQITHRHGMQMVATEPGLTSQEPKSVQIRAHLRMQCTYPQFVAFLDDLARETSLLSVDRFLMIESRDGRQILDLWLTRYILRPEAAK